MNGLVEVALRRGVERHDDSMEAGRIDCIVMSLEKTRRLRLIQHVPTYHDILAL